VPPGEPTTTVERPAAPRTRVADGSRTVRLLLDRAVLERVREGRLRDVGWPRGLDAVVAVGGGLIGIACLLALGSHWLRGAAELDVPAATGSSVPQPLVGLLLVLLAVTLALGQHAGLHGPWWLLLLTTTVCALVMGTFGLHTALAAGPVVPIAVAVLIAGLVVFSVVRHRRKFAWWEFPVLVASIGFAIALGTGDFAFRGRQVGANIVPDLAAITVSSLMQLSLPAAVAAGTAVAELTVGLTVTAAAQADRRRTGPAARGSRWAYAVLAGLVTVRAVEVGWRLTHLDPVRQGWLAVLPGLAVVVALAAVSAVLLRLARSGPPIAVSTLPDELGRVALPLGAAIVGLTVPILVAATAYTVAVFLAPTAAAGRGSLDGVVAVSELTDVIRIGLAIVLVALGVRLARRGRAARAVLFGCIAVTLTATAMRSLTGQRWAIWFDPDTVNLLASVGVLGLLGTYAVRRRLTPGRAVAGSALLVLMLLFSLRRYLGDPVGEIVGYSGLGLAVFGLLWDLLTGAGWGNGDSRRFPRPTRVLLVLTNTAMLAVVVAYAALIRDAGRFSVDAFVELGDLVLGVGLVAAAFAVIVQAFVGDRPLD
jgi:hypothetical protein